MLSYLGLFQPNATWSGRLSQGQPHIPTEHAKPNGQSIANATKAFPFQPSGKSVATSWYRSPHSPYPAYGNDGHWKKPYGLPDGSSTQSESPTLQSSSSNSSTQHQHTPNLQYAYHNGPQSSDGRTGSMLNRDVRHPIGMGPSERAMYPNLSNPPSTSFYAPQAPPTPRHPSMMQFSHPMGSNHPSVSPFSVNPPAPAHGRGKNRTNKNYQCPKCAKV